MNIDRYESVSSKTIRSKKTHGKLKPVLACLYDFHHAQVGIGGEYDSTNIINSSVCTGISSLGLDHTTLLGDNLESIAYQKSGIFRPGTPAFTVQQPNDAMSVLQSRAREKNCTLSTVSSIDSYPWTKSVPTLGIRLLHSSYFYDLIVLKK